MNPRLRELIEEYLHRTSDAEAILRKHLGTAPMDWRCDGHAQTGETSEGIRYFFHGIGVSVHLPIGPIDFDYGWNGRVDGFCPWKIAQLAQHLGSKYSEFHDWVHVQALLDAAAVRGEVEQSFKSHHDDLFYLATNA